jgi:hypothetical protein
MGTRAISLGVNWPERVAGHSSQLKLKLRIHGVIPPLSHIMAWCLVKYRDIPDDDDNSFVLYCV